MAREATTAPLHLLLPPAPHSALLLSPGPPNPLISDTCIPNCSSGFPFWLSGPQYL